MRPLAICLVPMLGLTGCLAHQPTSESAEVGPLRYKVSYSINTATGGERCVVEFEGHAFPVYDTTESEPFYRFCRKVFPDEAPAERWWTYWRVPYVGSDLERDLPPHQVPDFMRPIGVFEVYEPAAVSIYEEIRKGGGRPWQDTRSVLAMVYSSAEPPWPSDAKKLLALLGKWVLWKRGDAKEWTGHRVPSSREINLLPDMRYRIDRPRSLAVKCNEGQLKAYLQRRTGERE